MDAVAQVGLLAGNVVRTTDGGENWIVDTLNFRTWGMAVVDASNPKNPELVKLMPGTPGTRESQVEANEARKIVIVMPFSRETPYGDAFANRVSFA